MPPRKRAKQKSDSEDSNSAGNIADAITSLWDVASRTSDLSIDISADLRKKLKEVLRMTQGTATQTSKVAKEEDDWNVWATSAGVIFRPDCDADDFKGLFLKKDAPCIDTDALKISDTDGADTFRCKPYLTALHDDLRSFPDDWRATRLKIDSKLSRQYLE
ncbi:hypothetical protein EUX98_g6626 [Antrodiella citrinella]|uniref:Uncharacterized protein n=1 Tax=Antrodiella citrinella TaxID=2447956 RepID=A0A4S4MR23_9APHY|nr:hypothetical protein EUX98_g6626 [Antrodiella citrinella]